MPYRPFSEVVGLLLSAGGCVFAEPKTHLTGQRLELLQRGRIVLEKVPGTILSAWSAKFLINKTRIGQARGPRPRDSINSYVPCPRPGERPCCATDLLKQCAERVHWRRAVTTHDGAEVAAPSYVIDIDLARLAPQSRAFRSREDVVWSPRAWKTVPAPAWSELF